MHVLYVRYVVYLLYVLHVLYVLYLLSALFARYVLYVVCLLYVCMYVRLGAGALAAGSRCTFREPVTCSLSSQAENLCPVITFPLCSRPSLATTPSPTHHSFPRSPLPPLVTPPSPSHPSLPWSPIRSPSHFCFCLPG